MVEGARLENAALELSRDVLKHERLHPLGSPAGGAHSKAQSAKYILVHNAGSGPGEKGWRWCSKCQGLFLGEASLSKCPADGTAHHKSGGEYPLIR